MKRQRALHEPELSDLIEGFCSGLVIVRLMSDLMYGLSNSYIHARNYHDHFALYCQRARLSKCSEHFR